MLLDIHISYTKSFVPFYFDFYHFDIVEVSFVTTLWSQRSRFAFDSSHRSPKNKIVNMM